jgi:hypothetical protein
LGKGRYATGELGAAVPVSVNRPPWQGQSNVCALAFQSRKQPIWVQAPDSAEKPSVVRWTKPTTEFAVKRTTWPTGIESTDAIGSHAPDPSGTIAGQG